MTLDQALDSVISMIETHCPVDGCVQEIGESTSFIDGLGWESLDVLDAVKVFEEVFCVEVSDEELQHIRTVGDVAELVMCSE